MPKIISKTGLILGTNLKLHVADKGATDISITKAGAVLTIASATANFTGSSETSGVVNRGIVVGDIIKISNTANVLNEGVTATITAVSSSSITATILTGTGVTETAGNDINIVAFKKTYQFLAASGLSFVDGVQGIILASKMVDLWDASDLDKYDPAFTSIEPRAKSIASINGWEYHDSDGVPSIGDLRRIARKQLRFVSRNPIDGVRNGGSGRFTVILTENPKEGWLRLDLLFTPETWNNEATDYEPLRN